MDQQTIQLIREACQASIANNVPTAEQRTQKKVNSIKYAVTKGLNGAPKYDGKTNWREFKQCWDTWRSLLDLDYQENGRGVVPADFQANAMISRIHGTASTRIQTLAQGTPAFNETILNAEEPDQNQRFKLWLARVEQLFQPKVESTLARVDFEALKQKWNVDISSYVSEKIAMWHLAYGENAPTNHFQVLLDETIKGVYNTVVKRELRKANPRDPETLRNTLIEIAANERMCFEDGTAESTSLDGLATVTKSYTGQNTEMMEGVQAIREATKDDICNFCKKKGHFARDCRLKTQQNPRFPPNNPAHRNLTCDFCHIRGHVARDCRKKKASTGGRGQTTSTGSTNRNPARAGNSTRNQQNNNRTPRRVNQIEEDDEETGDDDFDSNPFLGEGEEEEEQDE